MGDGVHDRGAVAAEATKCFEEVFVAGDRYRLLDLEGRSKSVGSAGFLEIPEAGDCKDAIEGSSDGPGVDAAIDNSRGSVRQEHREVCVGEFLDHLVQDGAGRYRQAAAQLDVSDGALSNLHPGIQPAHGGPVPGQFDFRT
jgi:hypothetical protein